MRLGARLVRFSPGYYWRSFMKDFSLALAAPMLSALSIIVCEASPAAAISVSLQISAAIWLSNHILRHSRLETKRTLKPKGISFARASRKKVKCQTAMRQIRNRAESAF